MGDITEWKKRIRDREEKRVGDIYTECVKRGCSIRFLEQFDTRIWLYPVEQTKTFLELQKSGNLYATDIENCLKQWKIYLQVILEKRPKHEKATEWEKALEQLD